MSNLRKMTLHSIPRSLWIASLVFLLVGIGCKEKSEKTDTDVVLDQSSNATITISASVPAEPQSNADATELGVFAWDQFLALNWESSFATNNKRATANTSWDFATGGAAPDLTVWETFIHRTELRPANGMRTADLSTGLPQYSFIDMNKVNTNGINLNDYWVNLDEDNEIGSCYLFTSAQPDAEEILYMAKSNLVEYNYAKEYFPTDAELYTAIAKINGLDLMPRLDTLKARSLDRSCNVDPNTNGGYIILPCGDGTGGGNEGVIEIKAAWRKLLPVDDASRFLTREVLYYTNEVQGGVTTAVAHTDTMALIGLHIIRKTPNYPAFIYTSFLQTDQDDAASIPYNTVIISKDSAAKTEPVDPRGIPAALQTVNSEAHTAIATANSSSVWQYYDLIGVQATPIDYANRAQDENYFMANLVIESDYMLTQFHGSFGDPYNEEIQNVVFNGMSFNMGGCQGCHGQAQTKFGTDFSFLLDKGAGKPVPIPDPYQSLAEAQEAAVE